MREQRAELPAGQAPPRGTYLEVEPERLLVTEVVLPEPRVLPAPVMAGGRAGDREVRPDDVALAGAVIDAVDDDLAGTARLRVPELSVTRAIQAVVPAGISRMVAPVLDAPEIARSNSRAFGDRKLQAGLMNQRDRGNGAIHLRSRVLPLGSGSLEKRTIIVAFEGSASRKAFARSTLASLTGIRCRLA